jgi:hypothetical protein
MIKFEYDWRSRRIRKQVWNNTGGSGNPTLDTKSLYDNWNLIAILNSSSSLLQSFLWGSGVPDSAQDSGAAGGLLAITDLSQGSHFATCDAAGNVVALAKATDATLSAAYEYGPFGELMRATGSAAGVNPIRPFCTFADAETDLALDGKSYYSTSLGRTINPSGATGEGSPGFSHDSPRRTAGAARNAPFAQVADKKYYLSYETAFLQPGDCGDFSWRIRWHVSSSKEGKDDAEGGWIYQHVTIHTDSIRRCGQNPVPKPDVDHYEGFIWYAGATDMWTPGHGIVETEGKVTLVGKAFYTHGDLPTPDQGWVRTPGGSESDFRGNSSSRVPSSDSNDLTRELVATWKCCGEKRLTELSPK